MPEHKKPSGVRLKDIAERTGFSINTVSHALKDKSDISLQTRELIKGVAEEMGYIGNATASSLRSGSTKTVALVLGDISNPHFSIMVKEMETRLGRLGYLCVIFNSDEREAQEKQALVAALQKNVDGVILCPAPGGGANARLLLEQGIPFVLIGRHLKDVDASYVVCDDERGGYLATRHLLGLGHREILFLNGPRRVSSSQERLTGYRRALAEQGLPFRQELVAEAPITLEAGKSRIHRILAANPSPTAILAFSDMIAWEVIYHLNRQGRAVPEDVAVVGFDNIQSKYRFPVALSTVSSSKTTMSRVAVELLMEQIQSGSRNPRQVVLETKLLVRHSSDKTAE